jgi:hypothetical protein
MVDFDRVVHLFRRFSSTLFDRWSEAAQNQSRDLLKKLHAQNAP